MSCFFRDDVTLSDEELVAGYQLRSFLQPICSVKSRGIVGVEALARGVDAEGAIILPHRLFSEMAELNLARPWEMLCRQRAVEVFCRSLAQAESRLLFMNLDLAVSGGEDDLSHLLETTRRLGLPPSRVVIEVLESRFDDARRLAMLLSGFRDEGFLLALDDVGAGHSNLDRIPLIRPDILKVDHGLVRHIHSDFYKQDVFQSLVGLSRRIGALVVAEGVESEPEALTVLELGADYLQGFLLSRPQPAENLHLSREEAAVEQLAAQFKRHMVHKTSQRRLRHRQYNVLLNTLLCDLTRSPSSDFGVALTQAVQKFPVIECVYVLDETGIQVSETVCRSGHPPPGGRAMFRPAPRGADHSLKQYYYMLLDAELPKYTTEPYVSMATGNLCQTISTCFRDTFSNRLFVLCIDVKSG
jgi:EAL domain-containing protein (putative c-di-GMP-specific phosphodiesterase class I)